MNLMKLERIILSNKQATLSDSNCYELDRQINKIKLQGLKNYITDKKEVLTEQP